MVYLIVANPGQPPGIPVPLPEGDHFGDHFIFIFSACSGFGFQSKRPPGVQPAPDVRAPSPPLPIPSNFHHAIFQQRQRAGAAILWEHFPGLSSN
jgi:hypothetical protein